MKRTVVLLKDDGTVYDTAEVEFYKYRAYKNKYDFCFREASVGEDCIISEVFILDEILHLRTKIEPMRISTHIYPHFRKGQLSYETN